MPASQSADKQQKTIQPGSIIDEATAQEIEYLRSLQDKSPTPADQWASPRKQGFIVQLPSGNILRMRRIMNIVQAVKDGTIPNPLGDIVQRQISAGLPMIKLNDLNQEALQQSLDLLDSTVVLAAVDPKVEIPPEDQPAELWNPAPGSISIMDLTLADRLFITKVANGGTTDIDRFREEQKVVVGSLPDGKPVVAPTKRTGGTKRAGSGSKGKR